MTTSVLHFLGCGRSDYHHDFTLLGPDGDRQERRTAARDNTATMQTAKTLAGGFTIRTTSSMRHG